MEVIVVNATALDASGALTILRQFLEAIPAGDFHWIVFISDRICFPVFPCNIEIVSVFGVKPLVCRFMWDVFGVKHWLRKRKIKPFASLSLQNTNFRTGYKIPNYIYYHQSIPFFPESWSLFKTEERTLWFYKNIYPFFVRVLLNRRTEVFVQLKFIKQGFTQRFNFPVERIHIVFPEIHLPHKKDMRQMSLPLDTVNLFYPATIHFYKNHALLYKALMEIGGKDMMLYITLEQDEILREAINVRGIGKISFDQVLDMYAQADALVFPSYIETLGLPLIEAAAFGLPILAADLPYAREALDGYEGVTFIPYDRPTMWANEFRKLIKGKRFQPFLLQDRPSWTDLFKIVTNKI